MRVNFKNSAAPNKYTAKLLFHQLLPLAAKSHAVGTTLSLFSNTLVKMQDSDRRTRSFAVYFWP